MEEKKLDAVRKLLDVAKRLETIIPKYKATIANANCDKHELKFSCGSDMSVFCVQVGLTCYTGYYGNSSCGTLTTVDKEMAQKYLVGALNLHMETILKDMARIARGDAVKLREEAQKEIDAAAAMLQAIDQEQTVSG